MTSSPDIIVKNAVDAAVKKEQAKHAASSCDLLTNWYGFCTGAALVGFFVTNDHKIFAVAISSMFVILATVFAGVTVHFWHRSNFWSTQSEQIYEQDKLPLQEST